MESERSTFRFCIYELKELCELKATAATREGSLLEHDFEVTAPAGEDMEEDDDDDDNICEIVYSYATAKSIGEL
ncbi:hypothetical protein Aduo_018620 [Ancylostoma duodenale]